MLLMQPRTTIEPVHSPPLSGFRARLLREAGPGGGEMGGASRTLSSLLQSQMFREQEGKLKWTSQRIERCVREGGREGGAVNVCPSRIGGRQGGERENYHV